VSVFTTGTVRGEQLIHGHPSRGAPAGSRRWRRPHRAALVGLLLALGVAGCGGGGGEGSGVASLGGAGGATSTSTTRAGASSDLAQAALVYGRCMRQHGIDVPDPQVEGDRIVPQPPPEREAKTPRFRAASQACRTYLPPSGGPPPSSPSAQQRRQALAFATCMRQQGINLPDPKITPKGIRQHLPTDMDRDDPRLGAAEQACHQYGRLPND
jgi:hypothetical protein